MSLLRGVPAALAAEMQKEGWHPVLLVYVDWPSAVVRAHSGVGSIAFASETWLGVGPYGRVTVPAESKSSAARRSVLTLLADRDSILAEAIAAGQARGRAGEIWFGAVTERAGNVLVSDPVNVFRGTVDAVTYRLESTDDDGAVKVEAAIQVTLGSGPALRRKATQYHSLEDQQQDFPNDTAGRLIQAAETAAKNRTWPE